MINKKNNYTDVIPIR